MSGPPLFVRGKVRDTYDLGRYLLIIATDRLSAFDVVLPCGIPDKGQVQEKSIPVYDFARKQALSKGIIIADTKMEFGLDNGKLILIDELLTPDSSRFWDARLYKVGQSQPSYDKQPVRDWLTKSGWNKEPPTPMLPDEMIASTGRIYRMAYEKLTGNKLQ